MEKNRITAVVLAAGQGKRMNSKVAKQYLILENKPILYYSLKAFEESQVEDIILVVGQGEIDYCKKEIVERYDLHKVTHIITGGKERYHSVYLALCKIMYTDYVLIHDGARPFLTKEIIENTIVSVRKHRACVVGMPVKDTIKITDKENIIKSTPPRDCVWLVQTPQAFEFNIIKKAYDLVMLEENINVTDDAMVLEHTIGIPVKLILGSYENIKITTQEDLRIAESFIKANDNKQ